MIFCGFDSFLYNFGLFCLINICFVIAVRICLFLWRNYFKASVEWCGGPQTWAVVTGATDGIGLEFAKQLAEKGYNLLLISRSPEKLIKVKNEIKGQHKNSEIRVVAVDFTSTKIYDKIQDELKKLEEIHVLVNNVGIALPNEMIEYFTRIPNLNDFISDIINVNIIACTRMTALVLPRMEVKGRGIIINLSSLAGVHPSPLNTLYSSTKGYMDFFSRGLSEEYRDKGIIVQSLTPGFVQTKMARNVGFIQPFTLNTQEYVKSALKTAGKMDRCTGHIYFSLLNLVHQLFAILSILCGYDFVTWFIYQSYKKLVYNSAKK